MSETVQRQGACLIVGAGDGLGAAIARAFAHEGLAVCISRRARHVDQLEVVAQSVRAAGGEAHAFGLDARSEEEVAALVDRIEREVAPLEVVVFNIGANVRFPIVETTTREAEYTSGSIVSRDAFTFGVVAAVLGLAALLAASVPARKASRIEPMVALRNE